jgi:uncharacterized membrane protein
MLEIDSLLKRWQSAGVLNNETADRIRDFESGQRLAKGSNPDNKIPIAVAHWQSTTALILGAILLACGVALFVSAHWNDLAPGARLALVLAMVSVFHLAGGFTHDRFHGCSTALHAVGTLSVGPAIALIGQIFNLESHWPAAILLWAIAAIAGWILLRDQAQQTLALLLIPAWIASELAYSADTFIGHDIYLGRMLFTWAVLYLTFFAASHRKVVQGILFPVASIAAVVATVLMLSAWRSYSSSQIFLPFSTRFWAWTAIAAIPLLIAAFHGHKGLIPIVAAVAYGILLPWCYDTTVENYVFRSHTQTFVHTEPNFLAPVLAAAFAVFLCAWGVRIASRALVNFGIVAFAIAVVWFYFSSHIFTALGRSLGLIGLGILFLAGGWLLEKTRRRLLAHIADNQLTAEVQ